MELILACVEQKISGEVSQARELVPASSFKVKVGWDYDMSNESQLSCEFDTAELPVCRGVFWKTLFYLELKASQYIQDTVSSEY